MSDPIKIKITKAVAQPQRNQQQNQYYDPFDDPFFNQMPNQRQAQPNYGEGVFIVADIDNKSPMVNQPIKVVYKIYFDPRIQIGNISSIKKPKYNGYWSQFFDANRPAVEAQYKGKIYAMAVLGSAILYPQEAGIKPIELKAKEGLALINGTDGMLGMLILAIADMEVICDSIDVIASMSVEALLGTDAVFKPELHEPLRPHPGQTLSAANMLNALKDSPIVVKTETFHFQWSYENTYDAIKGTSTVKLTVNHKPQGNYYELTLFTEYLDVLIYSGVMKGDLTSLANKNLEKPNLGLNKNDN